MGRLPLRGADLQRLYETGDFDPNGPAACLAERLLAFLEEVEDGSEEPVFRDTLGPSLMRVWW